MLATFPLLIAMAAVSTASAAERVSYNQTIRPILSEHCFACHGPDSSARKKNLRLDQPDIAAAKLDDGRIAIVPGDANASELVRRIFNPNIDDRMPPADTHKPLSEAQKIALRTWIAQGAVYEKQWSFIEPVKPEPPQVKHPEQARNAIDHFVLAKLDAEGLAPAPPADRITLIRRLSLDLIGLPPTPDEVDAFVADTSPDAYDKLVDRLLANPAFGERMAIVWLDAARFSDTNGFSIDEHRNMWPWRDWVIDAFNRNEPYDQFITEQLAGDLLPNATDRQKLATGFLRNSMSTHEGGTLPEEYRVIYIGDKIDTVASSMLGLTLRCCQCHDHKYDPLTQHDYYSMFAFFGQSIEPGQGMHNADPPPVLDVEPVLGDVASMRADLQRRIDNLEHLRYAPTAALDRERAQWESQQFGSSKPHDDRFDFPPSEGDGAIVPQWIWAAQTSDGQHVTLHRTIALVAAPKRAQLYVCVDDGASVSLNGKPIGAVDTRQSWHGPITLDVTTALHIGDNALSIDAANVGGPAALLAIVAIEAADGSVQYIVSDGAWRVGEGDTTPATIIAPHGQGPWGQVFGPGAGSLDAALRTPINKRTRQQWHAIADAFAKASALMKLHVLNIDTEIGFLRKQIEAGKIRVMVMGEDPKPRPTYRLIRGQYDQPDKSQALAPDTPAALGPMPAGAPKNRLGLAMWLTDPHNPLTARVAVNRWWQMLFSRGLVATANDFGSQGQYPTHPELLDFLARTYIESGWDTKAMIRLIVTSATYRQSSNATRELLERDPENRLLARGARFRLPAELVRDNALAVSGLLDREMGGPSAFVPQPEGLWREISHFGYLGVIYTSQSFYPDEGADAHRRSVYTYWKRTSPPPAMAAFDAPTREVCTITRATTNTPLQSLVLLNDPQFVEASKALAMRVMHEGAKSADERLDDMMRRAAGRKPDADERTILKRRYEQSAARYAADPSSAAARLAVGEAPVDATLDPTQCAAWMDVASLILNLDEVITRE